ncbi:unnamed protein product [Mytilus coruscus]|uniref:CCHC-type domain-containing protein n=1 Tax=Mytilus coruscus TaxID=42192 RepID=A0A6J8E256_MYTCO|nr:unnamed protein product [Mytilus coruscus]
MSDESDSEIEFNMDKRETVEKNNEDSALNIAKQGQGDIESEFNNNVQDDITRQRNTVEMERNFEEERFGSARQQNRWLSRFEMRKRNSGETVAALGDDLRQMVQKAYCNLDSLAQEVLALNQLYKSIPLEMKCRCVDRECKTVADAVDIIERYEALLGESSDIKKTSVRSVSYENCIENKVDMEWQNNGDQNVRLISQQPNNDRTIQMLLSRIDKLENQTQNKDNRPNFRFGQKNYQNGGNTQNQRTCFICDSPDHFYRQCAMYYGPKFRGNKPSNSQNFRNFRPNTTMEQPSVYSIGRELTIT